MSAGGHQGEVSISSHSISAVFTSLNSNVKLETRLEERDYRLKICDAELSQLVVVKDRFVHTLGCKTPRPLTFVIPFAASNAELKALLNDRESRLKLVESELFSKSGLIDDLRTSSVATIFGSLPSYSSM